MMKDALIQAVPKRESLVSVTEDNKLLKSRLFMERLQNIGVIPSSLALLDKGVFSENRHYVGLSLGDSTAFVSPKLVWKNGKKIESPGEENKEKWERISSREKIVVSGICLFDGYGALGITDKDEAFPLSRELVHGDRQDISFSNIQVDHILHPYEKEYLLRVMPLIKSLNHAALIHIPRLEYKLYGLELLRKGMITPDALDKWFNEIDIRSNQLAQLIQAAHSSSVKFIEPLANLELDISHHTGDIRQHMEKLVSKDPIWEKVISRTMPQTFAQLGDMSYAYSYIFSSQGRIVVAVEDPTEVKILEAASSQLRAIPDASAIIGMYVLSQVMPHRKILPSGGPEDIYAIDTRCLTTKERESLDADIEAIYRRRQ